MYSTNICDMYTANYMYYVFSFSCFWLRIYMRGFRSSIHIMTIGKRVKMCKVDRNDP
jgi:hypothetical protein